MEIFMSGEYRINKHRLKGRSAVLLLFFVTCFSVLVGRLFVLQIIKFDEYRQKAEDNIQSKTPLKAERGKIYDRNMVEIATNVTSWRVFISPRDIKDDATAETVARGLSDILGVSYETVLSGAKNNKTRDRTVKKKASAEEKDKVISQEPAEGTEVSEGALITVYVSLGDGKEDKRDEEDNSSNTSSESTQPSNENQQTNNEDNTPSNNDENADNGNETTGGNESSDTPTTDPGEDTGSEDTPPPVAPGISN